ncbi:MAG TPA: glycosyltransferase family 4 protein [Patescibacteria group bacterium]
MKAAIVNPYWDTLGGGERYAISVAQVLAKNGYAVDVEWKDSNLKNELQGRFGVDLEGINIVDSVKRGDGYDVCFWVSDGSIPTLQARKNFLHFQVPFKNVGGRTLLSRMKLFRISKVICNSNFTKKIIDKEFGINSVVLYPPVSVSQFRPKKKENVILSVGRFSGLLQAKRQDILVSCFKRFFDTQGKGWKLVLAGGAEIGAKEYIENLKERSRNYPIKIIQSPSFNEIKKLYSTAMFFWSASGYGVDELKEPEKVEHFGITTVEAMASGAVALVYEAGGHKEVIVNGENGYLWKSEEGLISKTIKLMEDPKLTRKMVISGKKDALKYSYERFEKELLSLI